MRENTRKCTKKFRPSNLSLSLLWRTTRFWSHVWRPALSCPSSSSGWMPCWPGCPRSFARDLDVKSFWRSSAGRSARTLWVAWSNTQVSICSATSGVPLKSILLSAQQSPNTWHSKAHFNACAITVYSMEHSTPGKYAEKLYLKIGAGIDVHLDDNVFKLPLLSGIHLICSLSSVNTILQKPDAKGAEVERLDHVPAAQWVMRKWKNDSYQHYL